MEQTECSCNSHKTMDSHIPCCDQGATTDNRDEILTTTSTLTFVDHLDHLLARLGFRRAEHRVRPGLYRLGNPTPESLVFVSANYTLSFDALRSSLAGFDAYILVIDTKGINVWCAAGKGTFGTDEIVARIQSTGLDKVVTHRRIVVPQLGAPGVSAHEVAQKSGFTVLYGPVRAVDLPLYLQNQSATPEMREITFPLKERIILIPVELTQILKYIVVAILAFGILVSYDLAVRILISALAGTVVFPVLMPYLPTKDFSTKGFILGWIIFLPLAAGTFMSQTGGLFIGIGMVLAELLVFPAIVAYLTLNFTGCTPFASRSGVKREIYRYIRPMAGMFFVGIGLAIVTGIVSKVGVS